ncbi:hypothetical protein ACP4OV_016523 [Aristida adscensionis]
MHLWSLPHLNAPSRRRISIASPDARSAAGAARPLPQHSVAWVQRRREGHLQHRLEVRRGRRALVRRREEGPPNAASRAVGSGVERFRDMGSCCKSLTYVTFPGISGIESLPESIGKLRDLVVLDLRACHNLEERRRGITMLNRLEFLDVSECHLLTGVPRGLGQLTRLEVLKGFVVANSNSKGLCHLNELAKLERLRKLGIVIGKMVAPTEDEFRLAEFKALQSLKVSWDLLNPPRTAPKCFWKN